MAVALFIGGLCSKLDAGDIRTILQLPTRSTEALGEFTRYGFDSTQAREIPILLRSFDS